MYKYQTWCNYSFYSSKNNCIHVSFKIYYTKTKRKNLKIFLCIHTFLVLDKT